MIAQPGTKLVERKRGIYPGNLRSRRNETGTERYRTGGFSLGLGVGPAVRFRCPGSARPRLTGVGDRPERLCGVALPHKPWSMPRRLRCTLQICFEELVCHHLGHDGIRPNKTRAKGIGFETDRKRNKKRLGFRPGPRSGSSLCFALGIGPTCFLSSSSFQHPTDLPSRNPRLVGQSVPAVLFCSVVQRAFFVPSRKLGRSVLGSVPSVPLDGHRPRKKAPSSIPSSSPASPLPLDLRFALRSRSLKRCVADARRDG